MIFSSASSIERNMTFQTSSRIVVIAPNWLGDAVMSLPLVGMLRRSKQVHLTMMCPRYTARTYWGIDGVDEILVFPNEGFTRGLRWRSRILRQLRPAVVIVLPPSFSSAMAPFAARIPFRVGYATDGRRCLLNHAISPVRLRTEHLSQSYMYLGTRALARIDTSADSTGTAPKLTVCPNDRESLKVKLRDRNAPLMDFCLMVPGATYGSAKTWPQEYFRETAHRLSQSMPIVLAGGRAERSVCADIVSSSDEIFDMSGETSLGEFFALVESADLLIANDSGAAHVAGSLATPAIVIFGSTSPLWTAPLGEQAVVVRHPTLCSPCYLKQCPTNQECFTHVRPSLIVEQALELMKKGVDILPGGG
jgi:heptosyltransferase-2